MSQDDINGYTVAYEREEIQFPVYVLILVGVGMLGYAAHSDNIALVAIGLILLGFAYYNFPLLETGRPRLGAGQYGVFLDGLGIISWRAIEHIAVTPIVERGASYCELHISLRKPLAGALIADWRKRPVLRFLMRLPWSMAGPALIRVPLDVLDRPPSEIHETCVRMLRFYRM